MPHVETLERLPEHWELPEEPPRPAWADWLWQAWQDLDGDRPMIAVGMGGILPGRIPWSAADRWAERHGVTGSDFDFLRRALAVMDAVMMAHTGKAGGNGR